MPLVVSLILPCLNVLYGAFEGDIRKSSFIQIFAGLGEQKQILSCNYGRGFSQQE